MVLLTLHVVGIKLCLYLQNNVNQFEHLNKYLVFVLCLTEYRFKWALKSLLCAFISVLHATQLFWN